MGVEFANPLDKRQKKLMKQFQGLLASELGTTFNMPDYLPGLNQLQLDAFAEAQRLGSEGFSPEIQAATSRMLSGEPAYRIDPALREQYFQAQLAPARREFTDNTLRAIAEQYAGGGLGRSGDFQGALAQAAEGYGLNEAALLSDLINQDEQRTWEGYENAAQRQGYGIQLGQQGEMMPINTLMNAGLTQYGLEADRMGMEAQQQVYAEHPLANPIVGQWLPFGLQPYRVPYTEADSQPMWKSALGMLTGSSMLGMLGGGMGGGGIMNMFGMGGNGRMY